MRNAWPSSSRIAVSAFRWRADADVRGASKTTLPLERTVFTSLKPAVSNACFRAGILAFIGLTPRRKAAYRGMARTLHQQPPQVLPLRFRPQIALSGRGSPVALAPLR